MLSTNVFADGVAWARRQGPHRIDTDAHPFDVRSPFHPESLTMNRFRAFALAVVLAGLLPGCGEDQPNEPAQQKDLGENFAKKTADMMKNANSGMMDLKAAKKETAK